ncbi:MAG: zf-TFIIB domain-containing protein [Pseudomonadota bacterium]
MPLMSSPIDGSPMREVERYGVKMDICPSSSGIWLDKGELEKIIMMIRQEAMEDAVPSAPPAEAYHEEPEYEPRYESRERRPKSRKREGLFESLMDIFD